MSKATDEYGFVELARTFHELSMKPGESDDYATCMSRRMPPRAIREESWPSLIQRIWSTGAMRALHFDIDTHASLRKSGNGTAPTS